MKTLMTQTFEIDEQSWQRMNDSDIEAVIADLMCGIEETISKVQVKHGVDLTYGD